MTVLTFEGKEYPLAWNFEAICYAESVSQVNMLTAVSSIAELSMGQFRALLLAFIRGGDPDSKLTLDECGELIRFDTILPITEALTGVIVSTLPEAGGTKEQEQNKGSNTTFVSDRGSAEAGS